MKAYLILILKNLFLQSITFILLIGLVAFAITYPSTPSGLPQGGKFMDYFNKMLVNTGTTTDGTVKKANLANTLNTSVTCGAGEAITGFNGTSFTCGTVSSSPPPVPFSLSVTCHNGGSCFNSVRGATPNGTLSIKRSAFGTVPANPSFGYWISADTAGENNATWSTTCTSVGLPGPTCNWFIEIRDDASGNVTSTTIVVRN